MAESSTTDVQKSISILVSIYPEQALETKVPGPLVSYQIDGTKEGLSLELSEADTSSTHLRVTTL